MPALCVLDSRIQIEIMHTRAHRVALAEGTGYCVLTQHGWRATGQSETVIPGTAGYFYDFLLAPVSVRGESIQGPGLAGASVRVSGWPA